MEMDFKDRTEGSNILIKVLKQHFWDESESLYHVKTGREKNISPEIKEVLQYVYNKTARHLRFTPDFIIMQKQNPKNVYYLEYRCTQTPLYKPSYIDEVTKGVDKSIDWQDIGKYEREVFDNYKALNNLGVRVAVLNYIAYHERPLLCDFIENIMELHRDTFRAPTQADCRTPFVNFDATSMRTLPQFLVDNHRMSKESITPHFEDVLSKLKQRLPVIHHQCSPYAQQV